jgi:cytochrome c oxidase subunit 2
MVMRNFIILILNLLLFNVALADYPNPWQTAFQQPASPVMERLKSLDDIVSIVIYIIVALVLVLLTYVCIRFSKKRNPIPSSNSHNVLLEVVWSIIPLLVIVALAIPSFRTLHYIEKVQDYELTLKVVGHQWYWEYQYPDNGGFSYDSYMIDDAHLQPGQIRLLEVDNRVVLPVNTKIRVIVTSYDVIHSWAIPSLGIKTDAVPGRTNETWLSINKPGVYYGQCSELCGVGHGFMPIAIQAVSKEDFAAWVEQSKQKFGS